MIELGMMMRPAHPLQRDSPQWDTILLVLLNEESEAIGFGRRSVLCLDDGRGQMPLIGERKVAGAQRECDEDRHLLPLDQRSIHAAAAREQTEQHAAADLPHQQQTDRAGAMPASTRSSTTP